MSIVVCCNLPDGIIIGADSAATITRPVSQPDGTVRHEVLKIFTGAQKVCPLQEALHGPVVAWYGAGMLGKRTIWSWVQEVKRSLPEQELGILAESVGKGFQEIYDQEVKEGQEPGPLCLVVAGYDPGQALGEVWHIEAPGRKATKAVQRRREKGNFGLDCFGITGPIVRLIGGFDPALANRLIAYLVEKQGARWSDEAAREVGQILRGGAYPIPYAQMPLEQGIRHVKSLLDVVIDMGAFAEGPEVCDRPVTLAVITSDNRVYWETPPFLERLAAEREVRVGDRFRGS